MIRIPKTPLRLVLTFVSALIPCQLSAQTIPTEPVTTQKQLQSISFAEFRAAVLNGKEVTSRILPSAYVVQVLEDAPSLVNQSSHATLKLNSCHIRGPTIRLKRPGQRPDQYGKEIGEHLEARGVDSAVYIDLPIEIHNTTLDCGLDFTNAVFLKRFVLKNTTFADLACFQGAVFHDLTLLDHVDLGKSSDFSGALFLKAVTFRNCEFKGQANFSNSTIGRDAKVVLMGDRLEVPIDFSESVILGKLTLQAYERTFHLAEKVYLNGVNKSQQDTVGELQIKNVEFHDSLYIDQGKWAKLDFAETHEGLHRPIRFAGFCDFRGGVFDVVNLAGAEFERGADFSKAQFKTAINFERTKIRGPMQLSWDQISGKLIHVEKEKISRGGQAEPNELSKESYEELERNFKALGDLYSENECRYDKRRRLEGRGFEWAISGFWVRPWRTAGWLLGVFIGATVINCFAFKRRWFWNEGGQPMWKSALKIALRGAALKPTLPDAVGASRVGRGIFWAEFWTLKVFEVFLIVTLSNRSALLKQLLPYFT